MMSLLERRGAKIFSVRNDPNIHVSGHGYREELAGLLKALRPANFIPVHGTFSHLTSNSLIPNEIGLTGTRTFVIENGDVIDVDTKEVAITDRIDIDHLFVDSESLDLLPYETLRERLRIGELGLVNITAAYDGAEMELLSKIRVQTQGLAAPKGLSNSEFEGELRAAAKRGFSRAVKDRQTTPEALEEQTRVEVRRYLFSVMRKKPVVLATLVSL
jgi:ribonuclease J